MAKEPKLVWSEKPYPEGVGGYINVMGMSSRGTFDNGVEFMLSLDGKGIDVHVDSTKMTYRLTYNDLLAHLEAQKGFTKKEGK